MTTQYNDYYTYAYLREDKTPYYIGKGRKNRAYDKRRTIKPPQDKSRILFLKKNLTEAEAFKHEVYMIFVLGRKDLGTGILRNLSNGGEGASGHVKSMEAKKKCSEAKSGENNPYYSKFGAAHNRSKAIIAIEPDGTQRHYGSISEAARDLRIGQGHLSTRYLKTGRSPIRGKFKDWQFLLKNLENF